MNEDALCKVRAELEARLLMRLVIGQPVRSCLGTALVDEFAAVLEEHGLTLVVIGPDLGAVN